MPNQKLKSNTESAEQPSDEGLSSSALLAFIDDNFDRDDIAARWATRGFSIEAAERAKDEYERVTCELLSFDDVNNAIMKIDHSYGMFPQRVQWFFIGWILSANDKTHP